MNRFVLSVLLGVLLTSAVIPKSEALEILRWERLPLVVPLIVGQERVIFIDRNMRIGTPSSLRGRLRVQTAGGALYLRPSAPIPITRVQLQDTITGEVILLDIEAEPASPHQTPLAPLKIVGNEAPEERDNKSDVPASESSTKSTVEDTPSMSRQSPIAVALTRYAAQNLYAPLRTVEPVIGVAHTNLRSGQTLPTLLPTLPICATALAAWRLDDQWVTAVRLVNTSPRWLDLDPRALQGDFIAATFQHPTLGPAGDAADTTVLYLVTRGHGLAESLLPAISSIDASLNLPTVAVTGRHEGGSDEE